MCSWSGGTSDLVSNEADCVAEACRTVNEFDEPSKNTTQLDDASDSHLEEVVSLSFGRIALPW